MNDLAKTPSSYRNFLPALFSGTNPEQASFMERFLKIFEKLLTGIDDSAYIPEKIDCQSLAATLDSIHLVFAPDTAPDEYANWLLTWVGLSLKEDWNIEKRKDVLKKIIPLYRIRGTKKGLEELIRIYVGGGVEISELIGSFQIGESEIGKSRIGSGVRPYFFIVDVQIPERDPHKIKRKLQNLRKLLDAQIPVHTYYKINPLYPAMKIGEKTGCIIGESTLIGNSYNN